MITKINEKEQIYEQSIYWTGILNKQAQICAEGCEEENITHIFGI